MQDVAFKNAFFFIFRKRKLCKDNPKAAPGIKPILFTQVHYHLYRRSYLNDFFILISVIFFSYFHTFSFSPGRTHFCSLVAVAFVKVSSKLGLFLIAHAKNAQTELVTSNLSIYLSQVWFIQTRKPNLHPLTTLFLTPYSTHPGGKINLANGWQNLILRGWNPSVFSISGGNFHPRYKKSSNDFFNHYCLKWTSPIGIEPTIES